MSSVSIFPPQSPYPRETEARVRSETSPFSGPAALLEIPAPRKHRSMPRRAPGFRAPPSGPQSPSLPPLSAVAQPVFWAQESRPLGGQLKEALKAFEGELQAEQDLYWQSASQEFLENQKDDDRDDDLENLVFDPKSWESRSMRLRRHALKLLGR